MSSSAGRWVSISPAWMSAEFDATFIYTWKVKLCLTSSPGLATVILVPVGVSIAMLPVMDVASWSTNTTDRAGDTYHHQQLLYSEGSSFVDIVICIKLKEVQCMMIDLPWLVMGGLSKEVAWFAVGISRCRFRPDRSFVPNTLSIGQKAYGVGIRWEQPENQDDQSKARKQEPWFHHQPSESHLIITKQSHVKKYKYTKLRVMHFHLPCKAHLSWVATISDWERMRL